MTCPLCGQKQHEGPCYRELREEWKQRRVDELIEAWRIRVVDYTFSVDEGAIGEASESAVKNENNSPNLQPCSSRAAFSGHFQLGERG
jgi:hypothetical protein